MMPLSPASITAGVLDTSMFYRPSQCRYCVRPCRRLLQDAVIRTAGKILNVEGVPWVTADRSMQRSP